MTNQPPEASPETEPRHADSVVIDRLGGTFEVARLCEVKPPSVSEWRKTGIPKARRQYLELLRPEAFTQCSGVSHAA